VGEARQCGAGGGGGNGNATEHQRDAPAPRLHEEESRATLGSPPPPAVWKAVSVTPLDRTQQVDRGGSSGQKSPGLPLVESTAFPKPTYECFEGETRLHRGLGQDAVRRVASGGGVVAARKVVEGWL
ncbi:hypothetical protein V496_05678, partial [Pseudogymnoascus sp. VKM F-4515 (FW-2607)]